MNSAASVESILMAPVLRFAEELGMKFIELNEAFELITFHAKPLQKVLRRRPYGYESTVFVVIDNARAALGSIYYVSGVGTASVNQVFSKRPQLIELVKLLVSSWMNVQETVRAYTYPADLQNFSRLLGDAVHLQLELERSLAEVKPSSDRLQRHFDLCVTDTTWSLFLSVKRDLSETDLSNLQKNLRDQYTYFKPLADLRDQLSSRMNEPELLTYLDLAKSTVAGDRWRTMTKRDPKQERLRVLQRQRLEDELLVDVLLNGDEQASSWSSDYCRTLKTPLSTKKLDSCSSAVASADYTVLKNCEKLSYSE